jgi:hypothetical protein
MAPRVKNSDIQPSDSLLAGSFFIHLQHISVTVTAFLHSSLIFSMALDMHFRMDYVRGPFTKGSVNGFPIDSFVSV